MTKKILGSLAIVGMIAVAATTLAQTSSTTPSQTVINKISCVGTAVNAREQAIDTAMSTYTQGVNAAYGARATALSQAYSQTTMKSVRSAVKAAWSTFNASVKSARKAWQTARNTAWTQYRTTAVQCKAPAGTGDGVNSSLEASGN